MDQTIPAQPKKILRMLFIEDDLDISFIYRKEFEDNGFIVDTAYTGEEGVEKAKSFLPDVILLDIMLPKISGLEVLEIIKKEETTKNIPVILLTNLSDDKTIEIGFKEKADGFLLKSAEVPSQVITEVRDILSQHARNNPTT